MTLYWGQNRELSYMNTRNVPIILIGEDEVPVAFFHYRFQSKMVIVRFDGHSPCGELQVGRLAATVLKM